MPSLCDACQSAQGSIGIGGSLVCRSCESRVRQLVEERRAQGKRLNVRLICQQVYVADHAGPDIIVRRVPRKLHEAMQAAARRAEITQRDFILAALREKLNK